MADAQTNPDVLSGEDLAALTETYRHLRDSNDPRADKLRTFIGATVKSGNFEPLTPKNSDHVGFLSSLWSDIASIPSGIAHSAALLAPPAMLPGMTPKYSEAQSQLPAQIIGQDQQRKDEGHGLAYRAGAQVAGTATNVPGMEQSAREGDVGGVLGHAASGPVVMAATMGAGKLIPKAVRAIAPDPEALYQSALKPSTTLSPAERTSIINTGLKNEIPVSPAGAEKIAGLIDDLNRSIKNKIDTGTRQGVTVNKFKVAARLGDTIKNFENQVSPTQDINTISDVGNDFLQTKPGEIPASEAQSIKQGTYKQLQNKYGEQGSASVEAQKSLARGIKEELANAFPELNQLNQAESKLFDLKPEIERAIGRQGNHQLMGIGTPAVAGAAKAVTGSNLLSTAAATIKAVVDNPIVKSRIAIALNRRGVPMGTANARIAAYSAALAAASQPHADQNTPQ